MPNGAASSAFTGSGALPDSGPIKMSSSREEAAPSFANWKRRLETADRVQLEREVPLFLRILETLGTPMIEGAQVNFIYYGPNASDVELSGEFNQWASRGHAIQMKPLAKSGFFYHTMELNEPARLEYKFIVDGEWQLDPFCLNQVENGLGDHNSSFFVGDFHEPAELQWSTRLSMGEWSSLSLPVSSWKIPDAFTFIFLLFTTPKAAASRHFTCMTAANTWSGRR